MAKALPLVVILLFLAGLLLLLPETSFPQPVKPAAARSGPSDPSIQSEQSSRVGYAKREQQGYDMRFWLSNQMTFGQEAWDGQFEPSIGFEYPANSGIEHLFGAGPWVGAIVNGVRRVSEGYNGDNAEKYFRPNPNRPLRERIWRTSVRDSLTEPNRRWCDDDGDGRFDEDDLDGLDNDGDWSAASDDVGADGIPDAQESGCRGGYDAAANPDPAFDNFEPARGDSCKPDSAGIYPRKNNPDLYTELNGIPDHGEPHVDEDYAAVSDNDLYCSARDDNDPPAGHFPMGLKMTQKSYAWDDPQLGAVAPIEYTIVNVGDDVLQQVYLGFFVDADVGSQSTGNYWQRNYSCYLDSLYTAYTHNPTDRGSTPIGLTLLGTPKPLESLSLVFHWFDFISRPSPGTVDSMLYLWMSGGVYFPDPIAPCGSPTNPTDTRFLLSFGPFDVMRPGDTLKFTVAWVSGYGVAGVPGSLVENARRAHQIYQNVFRKAYAVPSPPLTVLEGEKSVTLQWGAGGTPADPAAYWDPTHTYAGSFPDDHWRRVNPPCPVSGPGGSCPGLSPCDSSGTTQGGRTFEGYRLYRSTDQSDPPPASSFTLVREYDVTDDAVGFNLGIDTVFVDSLLKPQMRYWYSVTSIGLPTVSILRIPTEGGAYYDTTIGEITESSIFENLVKVDIAFQTSESAGQVLVVPNPYRYDHDYSTESAGWEGAYDEWYETKRHLKFIHLPSSCTIRIFTVSGDLIETIHFNAPADQPTKGEVNWNMVSGSGRPVASGIYVYTVESGFGTQFGKFVIIR